MTGTPPRFDYERDEWLTELVVAMPISTEAALIAYKHGHAAGVDAMRAYAGEWQKFEDALYEMAVQMGFTGVGLGKRHAILQVFEYAARRRSSDGEEQ